MTGEYQILYLVNLDKKPYVDKYDGEEFVVPAQSYVGLLAGICTHFLAHNPKLELFEDFEACQARLEQSGFPFYKLVKKGEKEEVKDEKPEKPEKEEPEAEATPEPEKK